MDTVAPLCPMVVASRVEATAAARAGISTTPPGWLRTITMPVPARAGSSVICTGTPLWSPIPVHETFSAIVCCRCKAPPLHQAPAGGWPRH